MQQQLEMIYGKRFQGLPWKVIDTSVVERHPTFVLCELTYVAIAVLGFVHALSQPGPERRRHLVLYACALLGGIGNDVFFTFLPVVDNFWHAQATFMLSPRLPLYIVCCKRS